MQPDPGAEREVRDGPVIGEGVAGGVRGLLEEQEEAVGAVDLEAAVTREQVARPAVVRGPDPRRLGVAEALDQKRAVDEVDEEEGSECDERASDQSTPSASCTGLQLACQRRGCAVVPPARASHGVIDRRP